MDVYTVFTASCVASTHRIHQRLGQMGLGGLAGGQALAQVGAQAAQLGYAGDDAGLFGEGWDGYNGAPHISNIHMFCANAFV